MEKYKYNNAFLEIGQKDKRKRSPKRRSLYMKKERKRVVLFHARCSSKKFTKLVNSVNSDTRLQDSVKAIGFGNMLKVELERLPHDQIVALLRSYDPPTQFHDKRGNE